MSHCMEIFLQALAVDPDAYAGAEVKIDFLFLYAKPRRAWTAEMKNYLYCSTCHTT